MSQKWERKLSLFLPLQCLECVVLLFLCFLSMQPFGSMFGWIKYWVQAGFSLHREITATPASMPGIWFGRGWRMGRELAEAGPNGSNIKCLKDKNIMSGNRLMSLKREIPETSLWNDFSDLGCSIPLKAWIKGSVFLLFTNLIMYMPCAVRIHLFGTQSSLNSSRGIAMKWLKPYYKNRI